MDLVEILKQLEPIEELYNEKLGLRVISHLHFGEYEYSMSVQASKYHYCMPRKTVDFSEYTTFEVMLDINKKDIPKTWAKYSASDNVYENVPKKLVEQLIEKLDEKYGIANTRIRDYI